MKDMIRTCSMSRDSFSKVGMIWKVVQMFVVWSSLKFLTATLESYLINEWGKTWSKSTEWSVKDIVKISSSLSIDGRDKFLCSSNVRAAPTVEDALGWNNIEENDEIRRT